METLSKLALNHETSTRKPSALNSWTLNPSTYTLEAPKPLSLQTL